MRSPAPKKELFLVVSALALLLGCGSPGDNGTIDVDFVPIRGEGYFGEVNDVGAVVSLSNQVGLVTVVSEAEISISPEDEERGKLIARKVTMRMDQILWDPGQPGVSRIQEGETFDVKGFGWLNIDGERKPTVCEHAVRMEVGGQYIMPLVIYSSVGWAPIFYPIVVPAKSSSIAQADAVRHGANHLLFERLRDLEPQEIAAILAVAPVDPRAARLRHLPGEQRSSCYLYSSGDCP